MDNKPNQIGEQNIPINGAIFGQPTQETQNTPVVQTPPPEPPPPPPSSAPPPMSNHSFFGFHTILTLIPFIIGVVILIALVFIGIRVVPQFLPKSTPAAPITLSYWGLWDDPPVMEAVLSEFEREHPDINVEYRKWDVKQYRETVSSRIQQDIGPDIFSFHNTWLPMFKDMLVPIPEDIVSSDELTALFPSVVAQDLQDKGALYGIPLSIDTLALFINTEMFQAAGLSAPKTWEELPKTAATLTVKDELGKIKTSGVALGAYANIAHASDIISLMVLQNQGSLLKEDSNSTKLKNAQDAICFYIAFAKNENSECSRGEGFVWDESLDSSPLAFTQDKLAMYFGYSWDIFTIKAMNPRLSFQVVPVPQLPNQNVNFASYWVEGVSKKSRHQKEALELLKFMNKKEVLQKLYTEEAKTRLFGAPYARLDLAETLANDAMLSVFVEQAKTAQSSPFSQNTYDNGLNSELNNYLADAIRASLGNTSLSTSLETLLQGVSSVKAKYGIK